jgi:FlaA1/EpsC-like NDP-sugar epimerase
MSLSYSSLRAGCLIIVLEKSSVLITGAGGFIGSHLVEELLKLGTNVRALVRYTSGGNLGNLCL